MSGNSIRAQVAQVLRDAAQVLVHKEHDFIAPAIEKAGGHWAMKECTKLMDKAEAYWFIFKGDDSREHRVMFLLFVAEAHERGDL